MVAALYLLLALGQEAGGVLGDRLGDGPELKPEHLPPQLRGEAPPRPIRGRAPDLENLTAELVRRGLLTAGPNADELIRRIVAPVERELIQQVLTSCDRVQIKAAARLGINRNTLHKKLSEYGLDTPSPNGEPGAGPMGEGPDS